MKIISYHTKGPYVREAARLTKSVDLLKLSSMYENQQIPKVDWFDATAYKPIFIRKMLTKHKQDVLFVDSDAVFHKDPVPFFSKIKGQNFHWAMYKRNVWQTGTIWVDYSPESLDLMDRWIMKNLEKRLLTGDCKGGGQQNFNEVLGKKKYHWFKTLPPKFCWFDLLGKRKSECMIEHLQASRHLRKPGISTNGLRNKRTKRIEAIETQFGMREKAEEKAKKKQENEDNPPV